MVISDAVRKPGAYIVIGAFCSVLANLVLILGARIGLHYLIGCLICLFGVGTVGYLSHSRWTFRAPLSWTAYGRFILGLASSTGLVAAALFVGVTLLDQRVDLVSPVVTVLITVWNYLCARWSMRTI